MCGYVTLFVLLLSSFHSNKRFFDVLNELQRTQNRFKNRFSAHSMNFQQTQNRFQESIIGIEQLRSTVGATQLLVKNFGSHLILLLLNRKTCIIFSLPLLNRHHILYGFKSEDPDLPFSVPQWGLFQ